MKKILTLSTLLLAFISVGILCFVGLPKTSSPLKVQAGTYISVWDHKEYSGASGSGAGTTTDPYLIGTAHHLKSLLTSFATTGNKHFVLINNINMRDLVSGSTTTANWTNGAITTATGVGSTLNLAAGSVFDGNNYTISNLRMTGVKGLFNAVTGTVKNITFENVTTSTTISSPFGVVTGTALGDSKTGVIALFSRIFIQSGDIRTSGASGVGAIVGNIQSSGSAKIEYCLNRAIIAGSSGHVGGILGRVNSNATSQVVECANYGTISVTSLASGTGGNGVGGIVGCSESGSSTSIDWCYSYIGSGPFTCHAGIFGQSNGTAGNTSIMNSYVNAAFTASPSVRAGIGTLGSGDVKADNNWYNSNLYSPNPARALVDRGSAGSSPTWTGIRHTFGVGAEPTANNGPLPGAGTEVTSMASQEFVDLLNKANDPDIRLRTNKYVLLDGHAQLRSHIRTKPIVFNNEATGEQHVIEELIGTVTFKLPGATDVWTRVGHELKEWSIGGQSYAPGATITLTSGSSAMVFEAVWEKINYEIKFYPGSKGGVYNTPGPNSPPSPHTGSKVEIFNIDDENLYLHDGDWQANMFWAVLKRDATGVNITDWDQIGNTNNTNFAANIKESDQATSKFLEKYAENDIITLRLINQTEAHLVNIVSNIPNAGQLIYFLDDDEGEEPLNLGSTAWPVRVSLPVEGEIKKFEVTSNKYYEFEDIEIFDNNDTKLILTAPYDLTLDTGHIKTGYTIKVNLKKCEYDFEIKAALKGKESEIDLKLDNVITETRNDTITIDANPGVEASAAKFSDDGMYQFVNWKIYDVSLSDYVYGYEKKSNNDETQFFLDELFNVYSSWLDRYLITDDDGETGKVLIIAEYTQMFNISIRTETTEFGNRGSVEITVEDITNDPKTAEVLNNELVSEGSTITYTVTPNAAYEVDGVYEFDGDDWQKQADLLKDTNMVEFEVTENKIIEIRFKEKVFGLTIQAVHPNGTVTNQGGFSATTNRGEDAKTIQINDVLLSVSKIDIPHYEFVNFTLNNPDNQAAPIIFNADDPQSWDLEITNAIIEANIRNNSFIINANYLSDIQLSLKLTIASDSVGMGDFDVYIDSVEGEKITDWESYTVPQDTKLVIVAYSFSEYYVFYEFLGWEQAAAQIDPDDPLQLTVIMGSRKSITLSFVPKSIDVDLTLGQKGGGTSNSSYNAKEDSLRINDEIRIEADPNNGREVKNWKINGISIEKLMADFSDTFVYDEDNLLTIKLTPEWVSVHGSRLDSFVQFGMTTAMLLTILIPCIVVPLILLILGFFYLNLQRKKRIIKKYLLADKRARAGFTQDSLIQDVRAGKDIGGVSKESVKAAIKAEKAKKKEDKAKKNG